jgi:ATP-binding cassette subfamily B protein
MKSIKYQKLYRLFLLLSSKRKTQIYFLLILLLINGLLESLSISTIIPFLTLIVANEKNIDIPIFGNYNLDISTSTNILLTITILFSFFIFFSTFIRIFNNFYIARLTAKINIDLSNYIFRNNIYQPYTSYTKKSSSKIISLITSKVSDCSNSLKSLFTILLASIISLSIVVALLFYNWKVVVTAFVFLYLYYMIISKIVRKILLNNGKKLAINDPLMIKTIQETFQGFRDIIINNTEKIYINLFNKYNSILKIRTADSELFITTPKFLLEGVTLLLVALIGYNLSKSSLESSEYIPLIGSFVYALQRLIPLTQQTYASWASYKLRSPSIKDVLEELEKKQYFEKFSPKSKKLNINKEIIFKDISFSYDNSKTIIKDINLKINKGDHIGIYGDTGSGKSTFLDILMGLLPPTKGKMYVDGIDVYYKNYQYDWTSNISHVPQNIFLKEGSIAENIVFGEGARNLNLELLKKAAQIAQVDQFVQQTEKGFETMVGERGIRLSGGQRQRISLARAIYNIRQILVLDEATSALDQETENLIIDSILQNFSNLTIIMVSHRMKSLENCSRIFKVQSNGEILEE